MCAQLVPERLRPAALFAVKALHSLVFWTIQSAVLHLIYKGLKRETDKGAAVACLITAGESLIYAGNGFRCPLTTLAEGLGAERGSVTDIFLPKWLAMNIARIYGPLFALGLALYVRNMLRPTTSILSLLRNSQARNRYEMQA